MFSGACDRYFTALVSPVLFWSVSPDAISVCRRTPLSFVFFLYPLSEPLPSPPEPQCNIHDSTELSQRHARDTQKDLEKPFLPLQQTTQGNENSNVCGLTECQMLFGLPWHYFNLVP